MSTWPAGYMALVFLVTTSFSWCDIEGRGFQLDYSLGLSEVVLCGFKAHCSNLFQKAKN